MNTLEKIEYICTKKMLRIERWKDGSKSYRAGIEWFSADRYEFVCEKNSLDECLDAILTEMAKSN